MRICLVSREFAPFFGAGIGTYASLMAKAWAEAGHEMHVLSADHPGLTGPEGRRRRPGVRFHAVDLTSGPAAMDAYHGFDFLRHAMAVYTGLLELEGRGFDYIEFPDYWAEGYFAVRAKRTLGHFAGTVLGVRLHTPTHDCKALNGETWLDEETAYLEHAEESAIREADVLVSPTRSLLARVRERLGLEAPNGGRHGVPGYPGPPPPPPGFVVPYPFDREAAGEVGGAGDGVERPILGDIPTVLYFGRLEGRKGVELLVRAGTRLLDSGLDARFRFIGGDTLTGRGGGGGSMVEHLRRLVPAAHRDRFVFEGPRARGELGGAIRGATACCFPSIWENFPNALLEAMSLGAAVVGSDAGGIGEIIEDGRSGVLFPTGDEAGLGAALRRVLTDGALRARIGAGAPERVRGLCDPAGVVRGMEEMIRRVRRAGKDRGQGTGWKPVPLKDTGQRPVPPGSRPPDAPDVSVIIPHYNLGAYLPATLESVRRQTHRSIETIVVDDGSTDGASVALIERLAADPESGVRVVRKENGGLSSARNAGMREARGRWVVPLDADDVILPTFIEKAVGAMRRGHGLAYVTSLVIHFKDEVAHARHGWVALGPDRDLLAVTNCASTCVALLDREAVLAAGGYDERLASYEDWDLYCTLAERGGGGGWGGTVVPEFLIGYRERADSMLRTVGWGSRGTIVSLLMAKHPGLALHPDRALRLQLARSAMAPPPPPRAEDHPLRYRIADAINDRLRRMGVQRVMKGIAARMMGRRG